MARHKTKRQLKGRGPNIAPNRFFDDQAMEKDDDPNDPRNRLDEQQDEYDLNDPFIDNSELGRDFYEMKYNDDNNPSWINDMIQRASKHIGKKNNNNKKKRTNVNIDNNNISLNELLANKKKSGDLERFGISNNEQKNEAMRNKTNALNKFLQSKKRKSTEWAANAKVVLKSDSKSAWRKFIGDKKLAKNYGDILINELLLDLKKKYKGDNPVIQPSEALKIIQTAKQTLRPNHLKKEWVAKFSKWVEGRLRLYKGLDTRSEQERKADALSSDHGLDPSKSTNASVHKALSTCEALKKLGVNELTSCVYETMKYREKATGSNKYKVIKTRNLECTVLPFVDKSGIVKYRMLSVCANCSHIKNTILKHSIDKEAQLLSGGAVEFMQS